MAKLYHGEPPVSLGLDEPWREHWLQNCWCHPEIVVYSDLNQEIHIIHRTPEQVKALGLEN